MSDQRSSGGNLCQNIDGSDDIILGGHEQWKQVDSSPWEQEEDERNLLRENDVTVQQWLQLQDNSQPARNIYINSQSLPQRKRKNQKILVHVDDVFKPSPIQPAKSPNNTALGLRKPTSSNVSTTPINGQLFNKSATSVQSLQQFSAAPDQNTRYYHGNGYSRERSSSTLASHSRSPFPTTSHKHQASGDHAQPIGLPFQQSARSATGTDTSAGSKKPPKRQNSHSTDDDASSKRTFPRRNRSGINSQPHRGPPSLSSGPRRTTQPGESNFLQTPIEGLRVPQHQARIKTSPLVSGGSSLPVTKQNKPPPHGDSKVLSHELFEGLGETCPFWLFDPGQFSNEDRQACWGRKLEMSHVIAHLIDHHGFVRGIDPKNESRKYLASCQTQNPFVKAKGDCAKCTSLHNWKDSDFTDPEHKGVVICTRCYFQFDKREMQSHLDGPMCPYNTEQPKPKKMCILYTTFCSQDKPPSSPPRNMAPRKTKPQSTSKRRNRRSATPPVENNPTYRPAPEQASQLLRPAKPKIPYNQVEPITTNGPSSSTPSQTRSLINGNVPTSYESHELPNQESGSRDSFTHQQTNVYQPNHQPIAFIYPDTPVKYIADLLKFQRDRQQAVAQSTYSSMADPSSSGNSRLNGSMVANGFQHSQNGLRLPNQNPGEQQSFLQIPQTSSRFLSPTLGQTSQRGLRDKSFDQFSQQSLTQPQYSQQLYSQHPMHDYLSVQNHQQPSTNANFSTNNGETPQLLRSPNTPQLQLQMPSLDDLDATISLSGGLSHVQSSSSRVPSTAGESMCLLPSPNMEGSMWLTDEYDYEDTPAWLKFAVGSHLELDESIEISNPPPLQPQQRVEDLKPDSRLLDVHQTAVEKDSGYHSVFDDIDMDWDANKMFSS
ncbi:unnamed protein product [Fusarium graminearum]|nr:hypothetical protein FGRA07_10948 [Fusarium graminearum]CAG1995977.1 unnamed protein product [Fusarium graminearum]